MISTSQSVRARLKPLYVASLFNGLVFWYVVDKLLTTRIGVSTAQLGVILAVMAVVTVVMEIPSGILADRWSRKGVLCLAFGFLALSSFFGLIATQPWHYWGLSIAWGFYAAMYSGTYEAIVYDVLIEEYGDARKYEKMFGRVGQYESIGLIVGSLLGGVIAGLTSIKVPFAFSLASVAVSLVFVANFREPTVHKSHETTNLLSHIGDTFRAVVSSRELIHYFALSLTLGVTLRTFWEYTQFWYIQLGLPTAWFGVAWSLMLATVWLRSYLANTIKMQRARLLMLSLVGALIFGCLMTIRTAWLAVLAGFAVMLLSQLAWLVMNTMQQDLLPSRLRAGATSVFNSTGNIAFVPMSIVFGYLASGGNVTRAVWLPIGVMSLSVVLSMSVMRIHKSAVK